MSDTLTQVDIAEDIENIEVTEEPKAEPVAEAKPAAEAPKPAKATRAKSTAKKTRTVELTLTVTGTADGEWQADLVHGTNRVVQGLVIPAIAVAKAAKELHEDIAGGHRDRPRGGPRPAPHPHGGAGGRARPGQGPARRTQRLTVRTREGHLRRR